LPDVKDIPNFSKTDHDIDQYLDGLLPEPEWTRMEKLCLEDSHFFARVKRREKIRTLLAIILSQRDKSK